MTEQPRDESGKFAPKKTDNDGKSADKTGSTQNQDNQVVSTDGFEIKFSEIGDDTTRKAVEQMKSELEQLRAMKSQVDQLKQERDASVRSQLLSEIEVLSPHLAEKSQEKSIEALREILDTAKEFKAVKTPPKLREQDNEQEEQSDIPEGVVGHFDLATGKWVA